MNQVLPLLMTLIACGSDDTTFTAQDTSPTGESGGTTTETVRSTRGLWVWETAIAGDADKTAELLEFSAERGITTLFMACDPVGYGLEGAVAAYTDLVTQAHAAGLEVYAMSGYGWFTVPCDAGLSGQPTCWDEGWGVYETCAASGVGFDGIMDDSEPVSVARDHWEEHTADRSRWTVEYLQGIRERIGELPLHHALPAWYDTLDAFAMVDGGDEKTLDRWIADTVDVAAVMSYRDTAEAVIEFAAEELANGPAWLGVEICDAGEGDHVDFSAEGDVAMQVELQAIEAQLSDVAHFHGVMVHDYTHWQDAAGED